MSFKNTVGKGEIACNKNILKTSAGKLNVALMTGNIFENDGKQNVKRARIYSLSHNVLKSCFQEGTSDTGRAKT